MKTLFRGAERRVARAIAALSFTNPFSAERIALERRALGDRFVEGAGFWSLRSEEEEAPSVNAILVAERAWQLVTAARTRSALWASLDVEERQLYRDVALFALYGRVEERMRETILGAGPLVDYYATFREEAEALLVAVGIERPESIGPLFSLLYQVRRAFHHVFSHVVGGSRPTAALREAIWQSLFTYDMRRFERCLRDRMVEIPTLVLGASGTGKELVARCLALSGPIPFDVRRRRFVTPADELYRAINVTALSPTLIESELFGHRRGAFTGAVEDRVGWLEACSPHGAIFLDEIGDLDPLLQVKLLRVLETRSFQRLGETTPRRFRGKIVSATHRELDEQASFRRDLLFRLRADVIRTPTLAERLADDPSELDHLVLYLGKRIATAGAAASLADEVLHFIRQKLGSNYPWPGNVRELAQCIRNVMVRGRYEPPALRAAFTWEEQAAREGLTLEALTTRYITHVHRRYGSYRQVAARLGVDRRTVAAYLARPPQSTFRTASASASKLGR